MVESKTIFYPVALFLQAKPMCSVPAKFVNSIHLVKTVIAVLIAGGMDVALFGGWAEEITHAIRPRDHKDIDLLLFADSFRCFDEFLLATPALVPCKQKHFPHKRAFFINGILVELTLVRGGMNGPHTTFFDAYTFYWPKHDLRAVCPVSRIPFTTMNAIRRYRRRYRKVRIARSLYKSLGQFS